ncbi:MAG: anaerobic glycerol-3-phosphate dehydrogenase subunit C [Pirellulaceae bacterium]|nr:anaerobic glycerol-3-phosphate dehydrogenase subunit C [Pirellulaceae bacterium]
MDAERLRVQADLRGLLDGDVYCDPIQTQLYASDAGVYEIMPLGVVRPRHTADVVQTVKYAAENNLPLFPRGGGTGLAGQALGAGLVIDFSRYMRRVLKLDEEAMTVRVQPGLVLADLNRYLGARGLLFGPDPATRAVTTIGSVISIDSSGSHFLRYGTAGSTLVSMEAVLANGEAVHLERSSWQGPVDVTSTIGRIASEVGQLLWANRAEYDQLPWKGVARGCGYRIDQSIHQDWVDLARLQSGAEGTLALITEATIRVERIPAVRAVVLLFSDRLETAARAALEARRDEVAACDLMDRRLLEIAREIDPRYDAMLPRGAEAMLLIELQGSDVHEVRAKLTALVARIQRKAPTITASRITTDDRERDFYWRLCRRVIPRLYRIKGSERPTPFVDDIAIPPHRLGDFIVEAQNIFKSTRVTATIFSHAAHGQVHIRPFLDLANPLDMTKMEQLSEKLYEKVREMNGTIAGEHAMGLSRTWYARRQLGSLYPIMRRVKELFDPQGILNPGKVVSDAPQRVSDNLRPWTIDPQLRLEKTYDGEKQVVEQLAKENNPVLGDAETVATTTPRKNIFIPILEWSETQPIAATAQTCNGCGRCRTTADNERMCPMFRLGRNEEASPRAKANLMRGLLSGKLPVQTLERDELKAIADLCYHCHQCRVDCPASVDIPKIVTEFKAQYTAAHGLRFADLLLSRLDLLAAMASRFSTLSNWSLRNRSLRWVLEKVTGISQGRRLPMLANQSFMNWASRRRLTRPKRSGGRKVLYYVDQYANWHNPLVGRALVEVLQHQMVDVYVPSNQTPSWMTKIAMGDIERARKLAAPTIRMLAESVRQGYEIVTTEPSAALCLKHEYLNLIDNEDSRLVAAHTWDAGRYLWNMHQNNELELDFQPLTMSTIYHLPCHLRAIDNDQPGRNLLRLIPGMQVLEADAGCSGMAGTYGMKGANYRTSLRIGWGLISKMQSTTAQFGTTECSSCKLQMEQGVDKPTLHPIAMLAYAYGKLPEVKTWLDRRNEGLVVL